jgi:hypothetical protein
MHYIPTQKSEITMKNLIGGLFETQELANQAYDALKKSGFVDEKIHQFVHKPRRKTARAVEVSIQDIAKNALIGGFIGGAIGGFLGFLVGAGVIPLPYVELVSGEPLFAFTSVMWGLITGGLTGAILGVASRLLRSREKAEVMTRQIEKRGVLITVDVDDYQAETRARRVMEDHNALEIGNPHEKWDLSVWMSPNEEAPSLANTR